MSNLVNTAVVAAFVSGIIAWNWVADKIKDWKSKSNDEV